MGKLFTISLLLSAAAQAQVMRGRVVMPDGSPPPERAIVERVCPGAPAIQDAVAGRRGEFYWRVPDASVSVRAKGVSVGVTVPCVLRARIRNMESEGLDIYDPRVLRNLDLPPLILRSATATAASEGPRLPSAALKNWQAALKAHRSGEWAETERLARAVAKEAPGFAAAWAVAGDACFGLDRLPEARDAYRRAVELDAKSVPYRLQLLRVEIAAKQWADAARTAEGLSAHPDGRLNRGIARYMLGDTEGARADWKSFLELAPSSPKAAAVRAKLDELNRETAPARVADDLLAPVIESGVPRAIEAWLPGGRKALAAIAGLPAVPEAAAFYIEYCRAIAAQTSRHTEHPSPGFIPSLLAYHTGVAGLMAIGEKRGDGVTVTVDPRGPNASRILELLGWRIEERNGSIVVEPGDRPVDGARQRIPRALGIDEFVMQETLQAGRPFRFEVASETAPVAGGTAWNEPLRAFPELPGGIAEAFVRDPKLARAYAGLAAMPEEVALGLIQSVGLRALSTTFYETLWQYGAAIGAPPPGGPEAEAVWTKLAGASPRDRVRFAEALLRTDHGALAAFYAGVAGVDAVRQRFLTASAARAERFYRWYNPERRRVIETLPVGDDGRVRFPGGRAAWSPNAASDDDALWDLEALAAVAELERERGAPFDEQSARLLAYKTREWRPLFPYFRALPGLGAAEFAALDALPSPTGAWYAAAELIVLARKAGSLDDAAAAAAFGRLCRSVEQASRLAMPATSPAFSGDPDEAIVSLLRLSPPRRAAFDRIRALQRAPRVGDPRTDTLALTGIVYAATLDPLLLVLHENRDLLRRHDFGAGHFAATTFSGGHFSGGLMSLAEAAAGLTRLGSLPDDPPPATDSEATFRASARLVEVYPTVTDERGRHLDGLRADQFVVLDHGERATIAAFENETASISCALLLDTSQSMNTAVAALKSAAMRLIAGLRPADSIAVYSLTGGVSELQPFTTDQSAARRAVLGAGIGELTALHDGLLRVHRDLAARRGRKAIVVFTDGEDTASSLDAATAIERAKKDGVPIYTIAQGNATRRPDLLHKLASISTATGGLSFPIRTAAEVGPVFDRVLQDLLHGYLIAFAPAPGDESQWRTIEVRLKPPAKAQVRAREGYYPE